MKTKNILPCEIVRFREGKKKNIIGHREDGKIILSRNDVKPGYYRLHNEEEKERVILTDAERVPYDYFPEISYEEFLKVLEYNGFKIGFIEDFKYNYSDDRITNEHMIFAYDMETHMVIVAETFDNGNCFNSIEVYCPGMNCYDGAMRHRLFRHGSSLGTTFSLCSDDVVCKNLGAIHSLKKDTQPIVERGENIFKGKFSISLWNYAEEGSDEKDFYDRCARKINLADRDDMLELFSKSEWGMKALNSET